MYLKNDSLYKIPRIKLIIICLVPFIALINGILRKFPKIIEDYYSTTINKVIRQTLSYISSIYPYSLGEVMFIMLVILFLILIYVLIYKVIKREKFLPDLITILCYLSILYILFIFTWGMNYNRIPLENIVGLEINDTSKEEIVELSEYLIHQANVLREDVIEDKYGVMKVNGGYNSVIDRGNLGYKIIANKIPQLGGYYNPPKIILLSKLMSYTGITGVYMPYTGEANVNTQVPDLLFPSTVMHEMAHQRGFAREDEANYIAYLTSIAHPDPDFKYSGTMLALIHTMNALSKIDSTVLVDIQEMYNEEVARDLEYYSGFWDKYQGKTKEMANEINNAYLKSNGEQEGVQSYGDMVNLLVAQYREEHKVGNNLHKMD